ncbi:MAG TPA: DUF3786 domain-containing protein [Nitrospirota bacterium]|nr:DUF3786 domain-containing protein [Nitrospirota bacterium]
MTEAFFPGENKAWDTLSMLDPGVVSRDALVEYNAASHAYLVRSFGMTFEITPASRSISSSDGGCDILLGGLGLYFRPSALWYLISAKNIAATSRFVKPSEIRGGDIFSRGAHVLPLDSVAEKFGKDRDAFVDTGLRRGGAKALLGGDASVLLYPFPRIPVLLSLWLQDDEFPARADIFFDSTCIFHLPTDVLWSTAMLTVALMS